MSLPRSEAPCAISALPAEIIQKIYAFSPLSVLGLFAQISKQYDTETISFRLFSAAINAAPASVVDVQDATALVAIAFLKQHPDLLFIKKEVTDHYGRVLWASPYQIFLGAGDIWALKQIYKDIFPLLLKGEETLAEIQFKEQFPNYDKMLLENGMEAETRFYDERNKQQIKDIVQQLATVKQRIDLDPFKNNKPLNTTKQAIEVLCKLFQPRPTEVIRSGLHFPLNIIKEVYKIYNTLQSARRSFFSLAVIKSALDALSTVDGQCCQYGLKELCLEKGPNRRCHCAYKHPLGKPLSLSLVNDKKHGPAVLVDPFDGDVIFASSRPGYFDCFYNNGHEGRTVGRVPSALLSIEKFIEQKQRQMFAILRPDSIFRQFRAGVTVLSCVNQKV